MGGDNKGILGNVRSLNNISSQFTQIRNKLINLIKTKKLIYNLVIADLGSTELMKWPAPTVYTVT